MDIFSCSLQVFRYWSLTVLPNSCNTNKTLFRTKIKQHITYVCIWGALYELYTIHSVLLTWENRFLKFSASSDSKQRRNTNVLLSLFPSSIIKDLYVFLNVRHTLFLNSLSGAAIGICSHRLLKPLNGLPRKLFWKI